MGHLPSNVAQAAIQAGLPASSVPEFVTGLVGQNTTALLATPGVSPTIIGAGADALLDTYLKGFRNVWVTALPFVAIAAIGMSSFFLDSWLFTNYSKLPYSLLTLLRNLIIILTLLLRRMRISIHLNRRSLILLIMDTVLHVCHFSHYHNYIILEESRDAIHVFIFQLKLEQGIG
jgi:hypothetical protein